MNASSYQNPRNYFPAWRLKKGIVDAADGELEQSSNACELWGWWCGCLVVIGVMAEFVIAFSDQPYGSFWERWGTATASALVAIGVTGEVMFSRIGHSRQKELTRRSDERVAQLEFEAGFAQERAAKADAEAAEIRLELEREIQKQAPRTLSDEQREILQTLKEKLVAVRVVSAATSEAAAFASIIAEVLMEAGVAVMVGHSHPGLIWTGIGVWLPDADLIDRETNSLVKAFSAAKLSNWTGPIRSANLPVPEDLPVIAVGDKPVRYEKSTVFLSGP